MGRLRTAGRALAAALFIAVLSGTVAAGVSYLILDDSPLTDPAPAPTTRPAPRTASPAPAPSPTPPPGRPVPQGTPSPWPVGSCVTDWRPTTAVDCTTWGALRIVGTLHGHSHTTPCTDVPEATTVRSTGAYTLCLATP